MNEQLPQENNAESNSSEEQPKWKPLEPVERRIVGVLVEKAKTTPEAYPLTLNSITTACNQKSNRSPKMDLDSDDVLVALDGLRVIGAVVEIQGSGRVAKYKHEMYSWLGVDKYELAVVTELLLRGKQTLGELRGRAARMETIAGISELRPICKSLMEKKLMLSLTPEGRGQIVDHGLYPDREKPTAVDVDLASAADSVQTRESLPAIEASTSPPPVASAAANDNSELCDLRERVDLLQDVLEQLEQRLEKLEVLVS